MLPHITKPVAGAVIPATAALGDSRGTRISVTGTAQAGHKVVVTTGCPVANCSTTTLTGAGGRFSARVSARTAAANHRVTVTCVLRGERRRRLRPGRRDHRLARLERVQRAQLDAAAPAAPATSGSGRAGSVVVIGDSLAQGMQPYLPAALPGWKVSVDARIGRPLAEGMGIFAGTPVQPGTVYAFSLFTNDDPRSVAALDAAVRQSVQRGGCAVWATIVRPPVGGVSYDAANRDLRRLAASLGGRLQLVDWAAAVASHPQWVPGSDGVHSNAEGYRNRAALYAQAIHGCRG